MLKSKAELHRFLATLRVPESRRALVEIELIDHLECRIEAELAAGENEAAAELNALEAFGDPERLRASLERVEPAFELDVRTAAKSGFASAAAASILFALAGAALPPASSVPGDLLIGSLIGLVGFGVLWFLAPRGIGAAIAAEARASIQPRAQRRRTPRRKAVLAYVWSLILVPYAAFGASFFTDVFNADHVLMPFLHLWLPLAVYPLYLMWRARLERARHGA